MNLKKAIILIFLLFSGLIFANRNLYNINPYNQYKKSKVLLDFNEIRAKSYFNQGIDYYQNGQYTNACEEWLRTLQLVPNHAKAKYYFESVYGRFKHIATNYYKAQEALKKKEYNTAIKYFNYVERIRPSYGKTLKYLEEAYKTDKLEIRISTITNKVLPFTNKIMTIDKSLTLYANGYLNGKFVDKMFVYWYWNGELSKFSDFFDIIPDTIGTFHVEVKLMKEEENYSWKSGTVEVKPGSIKTIKFFNILKNITFKEFITSADTNISIEAQGYDQKGNFVAPVPMHWKIYETTEKEKNKLIKKEDSKILNYPLEHSTSQYRIIASNALYKSVLSKIKVLPGAQAYIDIEDKPQYGLSINDKQIAIGEKISMYAIAFDKHNNYIAPVPVHWKSEKKLRWQPPFEDQSSIVFQGKRASQQGSISIYDTQTNKLDSTGFLQVIPKIEKITIVDMHTNTIKKINLFAETNHTFYAAGFTTSGLFQKFIYADWALIYENQTINSSSNLNIFDLKTSAKPGLYYLKIKDLEGHKYTTEIHVIRKLITSIKAWDTIQNKEIEHLDVVATKTQQILFYGYNKKNERVKIIKPEIESFNKVKVWYISNKAFIESDRAGKSSLKISFINYKNQMIKKEIPLFVHPGKLNEIQIALNDLVNKNYDISALHEFNFTLKGFDKLGNQITNYSGQWQLNYKPISYSNLISTLLTNNNSQNILSAEYKSFTTSVTLYKYKKESVEEILKKPVVRTVDDLTSQIHICRVPVLVSIQKGEILYEVLMRELKMSLSFQQIAPYLNAVAHYSKIHNKNKIYPKTIVQIPYVTIDNDVRRIILETFFEEYYGFKNILYYNDKKRLIISPKDKIIILEPEFLEKGADFFPLEGKKIKK